MVVKARVVVLHPADQPRGHVVVAEQLLVHALGMVVLDQIDPQLGPSGELVDEALELAPDRSCPYGRRDVCEAPLSQARPLERSGAFQDGDARRFGEVRKRAHPLVGEGATGVTREQLPVELLAHTVAVRVDHRTVGPIEKLTGADQLLQDAHRTGPVRGGVVEDQRVRPRAAGPPRASSRSACSGASPASIAKITRSSGNARRPALVHRSQAACISAT